MALADGIDEHTLLCERCGYVLEGLETSGNCPECGKPIAESLPERRAGTLWQNEPSLKNLLKTAWMTLRRPGTTCDLMRIEQGGRVGLATMLIALAIAIYGVASTALAVALTREFEGVYHIIIVGGFNAGISGADVKLLPWLAAPLAPLLFLCTWIEARGLRLFGARRGYRVTRASSWTICAHGCVGWLVASLSISLGATLTILGFRLYIDWPDWLTETLKYGGFLLALLGGLGGFLFFEWFAYIGLKRCRFANRARPVEA
ncbi:MAG: hypothetical protein AAFR38_03035 [Planctomycetota bacterium]